MVLDNDTTLKTTITIRMAFLVFSRVGVAHLAVVRPWKIKEITTSANVRRPLARSATATSPQSTRTFVVGQDPKQKTELRRQLERLGNKIQVPCHAASIKRLRSGPLNCSFDFVELERPRRALVKCWAAIFRRHFRGSFDNEQQWRWKRFFWLSAPRLDDTSEPLNEY